MSSNQAPLELPDGMTLRDYFAAQVIGPLMASDSFENHIMEKHAGIDLRRHLLRYCAESAYEIADAMLAERARERGQ